MLPRSGSRRAPRALATLTALVTALGLAAAAPGADAAPARGTGQAETAASVLAAAPAAEVAQARKRKPAAQPLGPTVFQIASINLLGSGHTDGKGPRKGFANSPERLTLTKKVVDQESLDLIGFQEMHDKQIDMWQKRHGRWWGLYPGRQVRYPAGHNSITWRKTMFDLVKAKTLDMPYFKGETYKMPYVLLRHRKTKQLVWVSNVHLPANTVGNAQRYRDEGIRRQAALVKRLRKYRPDVPVYLTGDMNDRIKFFCPMLAQAPLQAANGGSFVNGTCTPPSPMDVDWVLSTPDSTFSAFRARDDAIVDAASDHPFIIANATIPGLRARRSPIRHVVVLAVDGLGSSAFSLPAGEVPQLTYVRTRGAGTLNARTTAERTTSLANLTSILTGRPVSATYGGHTLGGDVDTGSTVHASAGHYISSVFDMTHNNSLRTGFYTSEARSEVLVRTWTEAGGRDPYGVDNGTNKLNTVRRGTDAEIVGGLLGDLRSTRAPALSVVELSGPEAAGRAHGFDSSQYRAAVREVDSLVGQAVHASQTVPALRGRTLVLLVGTSAGEGRSNADAARQANYQVPFYALGPGVAGGRDLYALNPAWTDPGATRGSYRPGGPIHVASVANLALSALRLPALPGSSINPVQNLSVWTP